MWHQISYRISYRKGQSGTAEQVKRRRSKCSSKDVRKKTKTKTNPNPSSKRREIFQYRLYTRNYQGAETIINEMIEFGGIRFLLRFIYWIIIIMRTVNDNRFSSFFQHCQLPCGFPFRRLLSGSTRLAGRSLSSSSSSWLQLRCNLCKWCKELEERLRSRISLQTRSSWSTTDRPGEDAAVWEEEAAAGGGWT